MSKISEAFQELTGEERAAVEASRAAARSRFAHYALDSGPNEVGTVPGSEDPDNPPMTDEDLTRLRPAADIVPNLVAASLRRKGGRPRSLAPKVAVSIRLDPDVLEALRLSGEGWQGRANDMLRKGVGLKLHSTGNITERVTVRKVNISVEKEDIISFAQRNTHAGNTQRPRTSRSFGFRREYQMV